MLSVITSLSSVPGICAPWLRRCFRADAAWLPVPAEPLATLGDSSAAVPPSIPTSGNDRRRSWLAGVDCATPDTGRTRRRSFRSFRPLPLIARRR